MTTNHKTVMVFGTFDFLHAGHISVFEQAKRLGQRLIVVVARDERVHKVKGKKPIHSERDRKKILSHIDLIDSVILGDKTNVYSSIKKYKPDIIALGYDQHVFVSELDSVIKQMGLGARIVRLNQYKTYKSSQRKCVCEKK